MKFRVHDAFLCSKPNYLKAKYILQFFDWILEPGPAEWYFVFVFHFIIYNTHKMTSFGNPLKVSVNVSINVYNTYI